MLVSYTTGILHPPSFSNSVQMDPSCFPIRCFTCQKTIGKKKLLNQYSEGLAAGKHRGDVLDEMKIMRHCCRARFMSSIATLSFNEVDNDSFNLQSGKSSSDGRFYFVKERGKLNAQEQHQQKPHIFLAR